jgi:N6-adenosine-specific RNA methylase IME4
MPGTHYAWPRTSRHSAKPAQFFALVEAVSHGPFLEMFARGPRAGWTVWGDEAFPGWSAEDVVRAVMEA